MKLQLRADDGTLLKEEIFTNADIKALKHISSGDTGIWQWIVGNLRRRVKAGKEAIRDEALARVEDGTIIAEAGDKEDDLMVKWAAHDDYKDAAAREAEDV